MASFLSVLDLSKAPYDVIVVLLEHMGAQQRFTCALVCSDWAKAAAAATHSIVKYGVKDLTQLQQWLEKHGSQIEVLQLHRCRQVTLAGLPCNNLQELLLEGYSSGRDQAFILDSRVWRDIAAATKLTSVSLRQLCTESKQADVVSALTALPDLQQLTWWEVRFGQKGMLPYQWSDDSAFKLVDSRLLQQLTQLTSLSLRGATEEVLQHVTVLTKLQHLYLWLLLTWPAADVTALQELKAITSLTLYWGGYKLQFPDSVSHLTALQQLQLKRATVSGLDSLASATALTKLVGQLTSHVRAAPLQLATLQELRLEGDQYLTSWEDPNQLMLPTSYLAHCTQLMLPTSYLAHCTQLMLPTSYLAHCTQLMLPTSYLAHCTQLMLPTSYLAHCTQLRRLSLRCFSVTGPGSLVASSMLQELTLTYCPLRISFGGDEPPAMSPWEVLFPGPGRLPHLTALFLRSVLPRPQHADVVRLVACCSSLRDLRVDLKEYVEPPAEPPSGSEPPSEPLSDSVEEEPDQLPGLAGLLYLTKLHVSTADDQLCSSLAQLTGLQELRVFDAWELSAVGLQHLACLEQLTSLGFQSGIDCRKVGGILYEQLSDGLQFCRCAIVNKAPAGSPPDVSARLWDACDLMAALHQHQHSSSQPTSHTDTETDTDTG